MNSMKIDEGIIVMADLNIELTIKRIRRLIDIELTPEEIQYYMYNHHPSPLQIRLVYAYYTKHFNSYRDLNLLTRKQYIILLLILKKKLLLELGYDKDEPGKIHYASLPYILTGNVMERVNTRIIRNNKFIAKLEENYMYQDLIKQKYNLLQYIKPDEIITMISQFNNTRFSYVTYEYPELLDTEIYYSEDKITDELLFFLNSL